MPDARPALIAVRAFRAEEWPTYRALRLRALQEDPTAFGSTWAAEAERPDEEWAARLARGGALAFPAVAELGGAPVGLLWCRLDPDDPRTAELYQMWVAPEARGRGVGRRLLDAAADWARAAGATRMALGVTEASAAAVRLYRAAGFAFDDGAGRCFGAACRTMRRSL